jgi:two-component system, OmpR family, sensor histidine kinase AdeS
MNRLSSYLFRAAGLSVLVALGVMLGVLMLGDWLSFRAFEAGLSDALRAELVSDGPIGMELSNALNAYYTSWPVRATMPGAIFVGTLVGGLVGMVHSRRLLRPLDAVAGALEALAQGRTGARAVCRPSRITEIDAFVRNFNDMAHGVERAERELRETNAAIAHELRTPLTVLIGRLNGMADGIFPMDEAGLRALLTQTGQLHRIIDDLNLLTLADAGRFQLHPEPLDLARLVADTLATESAGIETDLRPAPLHADPARMRQMLAVLLDNARRYADGRGVRVETGTEGPDVLLRVLDRGPGLTSDQAVRAFDRFWRADASRGTEGGGSGLGLAVLRSLAQAHGGDVGYGPRDGGGAVFTLRFPPQPPGRVRPTPTQSPAVRTRPQPPPDGHRS